MLPSWAIVFTSFGAKMEWDKQLFRIIDLPSNKPVKMSAARVREASKDDIPAIMDLILLLAQYENEEHQV